MLISVKLHCATAYVHENNEAAECHHAMYIFVNTVDLIIITVINFKFS